MLVVPGPYNVSLQALTCNRPEIPEEILEYNITNFVASDCRCSGCARKCCADGFAVLSQEKKCSRTVFGNFSDQQQAFEDLEYYIGFLSCPAYLLEPQSFEDDVFYLQPDGRLLFRNSNVYKNVGQYCADFVDTIGFTAFVCFEDGVTTEKLFKRFNEISKSFCFGRRGIRHSLKAKSVENGRSRHNRIYKNVLTYEIFNANKTSILKVIKLNLKA